ncbi:MAG: hypothetical protein KGH71_03555 [Candidatus Micrarchaeota archaeon]|nr:hypothetical protein [Candidatus Micrarchaeota archaeon]
MQNVYRAARSEIKLAISVQLHKMTSNSPDAEPPINFMSQLAKSLVPAMAKNEIRAHALAIPLVDEVVRDSIKHPNIIELVNAGNTLKAVSSDKLTYYRGIRDNLYDSLDRAKRELDTASTKIRRRRSEITTSKVNSLAEVLNLRQSIVQLTSGLDSVLNASEVITKIRREINNAFEPEFEEAKNTSELVN